MKIRDKMFGFEIEAKKYDMAPRRPIPPKAYLLFYPDRVNYQCIKCPNCGSHNQEIYYAIGGFQKRDIQNIMRAMIRLDNRGMDKSKNLSKLFEAVLDPIKPGYSKMLKCHPSRYGIGQFSCCGAKVWHDCYDSRIALIYMKQRKYYYKPPKSCDKKLSNWL